MQLYWAIFFSMIFFFCGWLVSSFNLAITKMSGPIKIGPLNYFYHLLTKLNYLSKVHVLNKNHSEVTARNGWKTRYG